MNQNDVSVIEKRLEQEFLKNQQLLKENRHRLEEYVAVSKEGRRFLEETMEMLQRSSDVHVFKGMLEEQLHLDKKAISNLEREQDELLQEQRRLSIKREEINSTKQEGRTWE